ncbi:hypothetical protein [Microbacterium testaceum]|uniref:hypothetical protein n=1 Tax=Microbacterium testaceum TaxID=2033 RepID=UPI0025B04FEB|nr:hypothetical protein [Microbacterium testaceum]WJS91890.1 hypothetical protein NYQ11_04865 [Microbacterium testaceum]
MIRRAAPAAGLLLAAAIVLTACTPPAATPTAWQQNVQTVADLASGGDYASALASLDALEADVVARRDAGEISADEADGILSRIATVRADLTSLVPTPTPTPTTEPAPTQSSDTVVDDGGDEPAQPAPDDQSPGGKDDKGPGNGNGNGNGKGPGKKDG